MVIHTVKQEQEVFKNAWHQRNTIMEALKNGTLSCLPGATGFADTAPAVNLKTGKIYHGANLLYLKQQRKQLGFPTAEYLTRQQIDEASRDNPNIKINPGDPSVKLQTAEFNEETKQWENKKIELYNIAQTTDPKGLIDWASAKEQQNEEKTQTQFRPKEKGPEIACASTEPEKYLGRYFAAVSMGGTFKVSPEQAKEFAAKFESALNVQMANGHPNPFNLAKITNAASKECVEVMKEIGKEEWGKTGMTAAAGMWPMSDIQSQEAFEDSRNMAILRCAKIMVDSERRDLARQILVSTEIDHKRLAELKTKTFKGENNG